MLSSIVFCCLPQSWGLQFDLRTGKLKNGGGVLFFDIYLSYQKQIHQVINEFKTGVIDEFKTGVIDELETGVIDEFKTGVI